MSFWHSIKGVFVVSAKAKPQTSPIGEVAMRPSSPTGATTSSFIFNNAAGGSSRNWKSEAGRLQDNSAVSVLLGNVTSNFADAPLCIRRFNPKTGAYSIVPEHPLAALFKRPNPFWTRTQLFQALLTSLYLDGNAYLFKARNQFGIVVELWWLPHGAVTVKTDDAGFVTGYKYKVKNSETVYSPEDVIHLKMGVNTERPELGESPLRAVLREICTDNEVLNYTYAILKNVGVPGVILSPKVVKVDDEEVTLTVTDKVVKKIKETWRQLTGGDNRGDALVMTMPIDVITPGFKPNELLLDKVGQLAEVRIAGAFGVPVVVVQFLSGLQNSNAKASYRDSIQQLYGCCLIPLQRLVCEWLDLQLLAELGDPTLEHFYFDRSEIELLQESVQAIWDRADKAWNSGWLKLSETRGMVGKPTPDDELDGYKYELQLGLGGGMDSSTEDTASAEAKALRQRLAKSGDPTDERLSVRQRASLALAKRWREEGHPAPEVEVLS